MAHIGQELALRAVRRFRRLLGPLQLQLRTLALGDLSGEIGRPLLDAERKLPLPPLQLSNANAMDAEHEAAQRQRRKRVEPPSLVEMRQQLEGLCRFDCAHGSFFVACQHAKAIAARRDVGVVRAPATPGLDPLLVEAVQSIFEGYAVAGSEADGRELEIELALARRHARRVTRRRLLVERRALDDHAGHAARLPKAIRVDDDEAALGGEPERAVMRHRR